ncbi:cysteine desulfurase [Paenibacillus sp. SC116]|uniref:cysteine desulfurase family protein n=1 Tax=Paenibacillus sp. SC116 TaxID=2968986 RepID=UPI00215A2216|nr:cysteine desulfurase family protein [Paenibacillus sp. SC116]MCR8845775.1 cysteine desulfurase [Paenibacillus sp. SC116]
MKANDIIYADYSASTPPHPEVIRTMTEVMERIYANPSSIHELGGQADQLVLRARSIVAQVLHVQPQEVIFTSGATESNNMAIFGVVREAMRLAAAGNPVHAIVSAVEHPSVYACYEQLKLEGVEVSIAPVDKNGRVDLKQLEQLIKPHTVLLSVMHVNNETGAVQPLREIGQLVARYPKLVFHVDGVQGLGKLSVELADWNAHLYSLSGHKIHGPKGMGILVKRGSLKLTPLIHGGVQEFGLRAGTSNVPGILAMSKAVRMAVEAQAKDEEKLLILNERMLKHIREIPELVLNSPAYPLGAPHIINASFPGMKAEVAVHAMEEQGIVLSTQSACSSKLHKPSRVLLAQTHNERVAASGLRISMDASMTIEQIDRIGSALKETVERLKPLVQRER